MRAKIGTILTVTCSAVLAQSAPAPIKTEEVAPRGPSALQWLNTLDSNGKNPARLLVLSPAEFSTAVVYLEKGQKTLASARMVSTVALNYKRMEQKLTPEMRDRAAAALVKSTEIEDPNLSLRNLNSLSGVNHPLVKQMMERLSFSKSTLISQQAKKHLEELARLNGNSTKEPVN